MYSGGDILLLNVMHFMLNIMLIDKVLWNVNGSDLYLHIQ